MLPPGTRVWVRGPTGLPALPGDSGQVPRACGIHQLSRATRALARGPSLSTSCPLRPGRESEGPQCRPALSGHLGLGSRARSVYLLPQATLAWVHGPSVWTSLPGDSCSCPRPVGSTSCPGRLTLMCEGPRCRPTIPGNSGQGRIAHGVDQLSQVIPATVRGLVVSTSSPG